MLIFFIPFSFIFWLCLRIPRRFPLIFCLVFLIIIVAILVRIFIFICIFRLFLLFLTRMMLRLSPGFPFEFRKLLFFNIIAFNDCLSLLFAIHLHSIWIGFFILINSSRLISVFPNLSPSNYYQQLEFIYPHIIFWISKKTTSSI